jgi:RND superfamily putative drug exporter
LVLLAALVLVLVALPLSAKEQSHLAAGDTIASHSQSASVSNAIQSGAFPGAEVSALAVVLQPAPDARRADLASALAQVSRQISQVHSVHPKPGALQAALVAVRAHPQQPTTLSLAYGGGVGIDQARDVTRALGITGPAPARAAGGRVAVHLIGEGALWAAFIQRADKDTKTAEGLGLPIVAIVLLLAFGSAVAAALPVLLALISIVLASAVIYLLSSVTDMSIFAATVASMIGLGVAIDYSLFILVRYREEIANGLSPEDARARAMATSGRAVAYSGLTVIIAQSALFLIASPGIRSIGAGAMIVVALSVLTASTVLPVLIEKFGRRAYEPGRIGRLTQRRRSKGRRVAFWTRWTAVVMRRPVLCLIAAVAVLLALASPALDLTVRNSAANQLPANNQVRTGMALIERQAGPGALAPVQILLRTPAGKPAAAAATAVSAALARDPAVQTVAPARISTHADQALLSAVLRVDPESQAARNTINRLRRELPPIFGGARVDVGGTTAIILDFDQLVTTKLWQPILFVLAASFLVMLVLLRSLVLPLKATLMNLLSVLASYGALVGVFQRGWLEGLGLHKAATIYPITMPLVLTLAVGLSMDYHIFMLSRIQERYRVSGDTRSAVTDALASSASSITSAALIMVIVFLAFVSTGAPSIQQFGFALAVAIAIDATIVRLVIVPAAMVLLGDWNWWLPKPLGRVGAVRPLAEAEN